MSLFKSAVPLLLLPLVAALGACSSAKPKFQDDQLFSSTASPFSRNFDAPATDACEAARRGLLSQGYMTTATHPDAIDATKNFQPASDTHIVVEVHVVCAAADASNNSIVYVNAVQNGYALKKSDTSASVGLSVLGSVSLPIRTNSDSMVKISSETIQSGAFYEKFFNLVGRYLRTSARSEPVPGGAIEITPLPPPVSPTPAVAVVTPPAAPAVAIAAHTAAPASGAATGTPIPAAADAHADTTSSPAAAPEHTASTQTATTAATNAVAATLPGIGLPPILAAPSNEKAMAAVSAAARTSAAQVSNTVAAGAQAANSQISNTQAPTARPATVPAPAAPAPASSQTGTTSVAAAPAPAASATVTLKPAATATLTPATPVAATPTAATSATATSTSVTSVAATSTSATSVAATPPPATPATIPAAP